MVAFVIMFLIGVVFFVVEANGLIKENYSLQDETPTTTSNDAKQQRVRNFIIFIIGCVILFIYYFN